MPLSPIAGHPAAPMNPIRPSRVFRFRSIPYLSALFLAGGLLGTSCSTTGREAETLASIHDATRHGRHEEAVRIADSLRTERPDDPEVEEAHRLATVGFYLEQGRRATFRDDDLEALAWFRDALAIAQENALVQEWILKTRNKLADRWLEIAHEAYASDQLPAGLEAYSKALSYRLNDSSALAGFAELTILVNYRNGLGLQYYDEGVRALSDYWLQRAKRDFSVTRKYLPENERAGRRISDVDVLLARQRVSVAKALEADNLFAGAQAEFKLALVLDPENEDAEAGIARVDSEAQAAQFLRDAGMRIFRGEFNKALDLLAEGEQLTVVQKELFEEARESISTARVEEMYAAALNKEHDQRYEEAIVGYGVLLTHTDFYKDTRTRKETLESYVEQAERYYRQAMEANDPAEKLMNLRAIEGFWPEYKNIRLQIARLEE
jgi:tetratricopeptide (TPR) repeat protein